MTTPAADVTGLPRYQRPPESPAAAPVALEQTIPWRDAPAAIAASPLSPGSRTLLLGLLRSGTCKIFPGGGAGIEYGSLLKTAARPDLLGEHIGEAAAHLRERAADLLLVPGMSGYPVGSMYALAARLPAILLKKTRLSAAEAATFPPGAFVIPSYTGEGDVVMSADPAAVADIISTTVARKLAAQADRPAVDIELRVAGADDIIDKATMSQAVGKSAGVIGTTAMGDWLARYRQATGDQRPADLRVETVAWVTPLIKGYNRPQEILRREFGITPFAGINVRALCLDPPALDVEGVGLVAFRCA